MEEEIEKAKADAAMHVSEGPTRLEPVAPVGVQINNTSVAPTVLDACNVQEQEHSTLRDELAS